MEGNTQQESCQTCYRIACKQCDWVANQEAVLQIQKGILTACPQCGWSPKEEKT